MIKSNNRIDSICLVLTFVTMGCYYSIKFDQNDMKFRNEILGLELQLFGLKIYEKWFNWEKDVIENNMESAQYQMKSWYFTAVTQWTQ